MAAKKVDIMEIRQLLLLKAKGESNRSCEKLLGIHRNTINQYVRLFRASGQSYDKLLEFDDKQLTELFPAREPLDKERYGQLSSQFTYFEQDAGQARHLQAGVRWLFIHWNPVTGIPALHTGSVVGPGWYRPGWTGRISILQHPW